MTTRELEKKYDLKLSYFDEWDSDYYGWRSEHRLRPISFWADVSKDPDLTFEFIDLYRDFLLWDCIDYAKWGDNLTFARRFSEWIDWWRYSSFFVENQNESTVREFIHYMNFTIGSWKWPKLSLDFVREFNNTVQWFNKENNCIRITGFGLKDEKITEEFIDDIIAITDNSGRRSNVMESLKFNLKSYRKSYTPYTLRQLIYHDALCEEVLELYITKYEDLPEFIIRHSTLSEEFIERYEKLWTKKKLWSEISFAQTLSEPFIEKYRNKLNWKYIIKTQEISEDFIEKHLSYIQHQSFSDLVFKKQLSEQFLDKHWNELKNLPGIAQNQRMSDEFIKKHFGDNQYLADIARKTRIEYDAISQAGKENNGQLQVQRASLLGYLSFQLRRLSKKLTSSLV